MVAFILVWDLCDYVAATFITKKGFHFEVVPNLIQPLDKLRFGNMPVYINRSMQTIDLKVYIPGF